MSASIEVLVAVALLLLPGLVLAVAAGLRGWLAVGSSPLLTLGTTAVLSPLLRVAGLDWSPLPALAGVVVLAVILFVTTGRRPGVHVAGDSSLRRRLAAPRLWAPILSLAFSGLLGGSAVWRATRGLTAVNQSWDAQFHSSAIRFIADTGKSAPSALAAVGQPGNGNYFYPNIYHLIGAIQLDLLGGSSTTVVNALAVVLPLVLALSTTAVMASFRWTTSALVIGPIVAVSASALPFNIIVYGALLPFATAACAAPALVALTERLMTAPTIGAAVIGAIGAAGLIATHPSVAVIMVLWCGAHVAVALTRRGMRTFPVCRALAVLVVIVSVASLPLLNGLRSSSEVASSIQRTPFADGGAAVGQVLFFSTNIGLPQWWLGLAVIAGFGLLRSSVVMWSSYFVASALIGLYVLSAAYNSTLTALWWDDASRFAALFVLPALLFATAAVTAAAAAFERLARRLWRAHARSRSEWLTAASVVVVLVIALVLTSGAYTRRQVDYLSIGFRDGPTLSAAEEDAFNYLSEQPKGGTVMNDPQDGSPYAFSTTDLPVVFKSPITPPISPVQIGADRVLLFDRFRDLGSDPDVADAVRRLDIRWVVVGAGFLVPGMTRAPGLTDLNQVAALDKVFDNGVSQVYAVVESGAR